MLDLRSIEDMLIEPGTKGMPIAAGAMRLGDVGKAGWRLHGDLQLPAAVLRRSALENNGAWMRRFVDHVGVALAPHGKTTMAPQLFDRQLRDGAWGLTCATIGHLVLYRRFGVRRVIHANQIVSPTAARWVARELAADPGFEALLYVDSDYGADLLAQVAREIGLDRRIRVLLEVGADGARTGVRGQAAAIRLAERIVRHPELALAGVATFEGVLPGQSDAEMEPLVAALLDETATIAEALAKADLFDRSGPVILSAGGSRFFDLVAARFKAADVGGEPFVILRSGCYISHDAHHYEVAFERMLERTGKGAIPGRLRNALEVWAEIQSRPEPGWLYANLGKRDISHDIDLPHILATRAGGAVDPGALQVRRLSDQHAHIAVPDDLGLAIGDQLGFGVSHPCTTFDKWRVMFEIDDEGLVVDAIATFF
jgi:D-serine dehydratase